MLKRMLHTAQTILTEPVEAEGTEIELKTVKAPFKGLHVYGKSTQETTAGKQLLWIPDDFVISNTGLTSTVENGKIHIKGTAEKSGDSFPFQNESFPISAGVYTLYTNFVGEYQQGKYMSYANIQLADGGSHTVGINQRNVITVSSDTTIKKSVIYISEGSVFDGYLEFSLVKGREVLPFEPYTGGNPSPNPDYPQEIVSAGGGGSIDVKVTGKNLWNKEYAADKNNWQKSTIQGYTGMIWMPIYVGKGNTVTVSYANIENRLGFYMYVSWDKKSLGGGILYNNGVIMNVKTMTVDNDYIYVMVYPDIFDNFIKHMNSILQIEISSAATDYRPYTEQSLTVLTPNGLPGIPVSSGGNYTDENGQQWVCDEVDFERGKIIRRIKKNAKNDYVFINTNVDYVYRALKPTDMYGYGTSNNVYAICDRLRCINPHNSIQVGIDKNIISGDNNNSFFRFYTNGLSLGEAQELFNTFEWYYRLETPEEIDLTESEITAYKALHSNYPTTIITNSEDAHMKVNCLKILGD